MKKLFSIFLALLPLMLCAHPGIGIVKDSRGNIFYTDLANVWKISPDGKKAIVVKGVHTHEIYLDEKNDLYGEHLWYNGEAANTWGHYVWCLRSTGKFDTIISPTKGFLNDYSFVRDQAGNMYWASRGPVTKIRKKTPDGNITTIAEGKFKGVQWMYANKQGELFFVDDTDLYLIGINGKVQLLTNLLNHTATGKPEDRNHNFMGIWNDDAGDVYVAAWGQNVVKKVTRDGKVFNTVRSLPPWGPTGGVFDETGNLWLLETNTQNEVRVRKIPVSEINQSVVSTIQATNGHLPFIKGLFALAALLLILVIITKQNEPPLLAYCFFSYAIILFACPA